MKDAHDWFRAYRNMVHARIPRTMPPSEFKRQFLAAVDGEQNDLSPFVRPHSGRPNSREWTEIRTEIFRRDDYTCQYCGERGGRLECDHIVPLSRGGPTISENLATACFSCNRSKRAKLLEEWLP